MKLVYTGEWVTPTLIPGGVAYLEVGPYVATICQAPNLDGSPGGLFEAFARYAGDEADGCRQLADWFTNLDAAKEAAERVIMQHSRNYQGTR